MAIPRMEEDVEVISKLGNVPGSDDGLTPEGLKNAFDLAGVRIKNYINTILIPSIQNAVDEGSLLAQIGNALKEKLSLSGGTMTGAINMNGKSLYNVKAPTQNSEAANKKYVDDSRAIAVTDAANSVKTKTVYVTLAASDWTNSAPFKQSVIVSELNDEVQAKAYPVFPSDLAEKIALGYETAKVRDCTRVGKVMTFECWEDKPALDIPVAVEVYV